MRQAKVLNAAELKRLNAVVEGTRHATRNATAVALSFYAGLRACEIAALTVGDVFDEAGGVRDTVYLTAAQTKGDSGNTVYVNKRLTAALKRYAATYPLRLQHPRQALIFSAKGAGFTAQTMVNLFAVFYKSAAISGASSHSGRRQFVTELAELAINPRVIQALARHAHLNTTMRYMDVNDTKLRTAVELVNY
jgi:integrase/recombinase XerD